MLLLLALLLALANRFIQDDAFIAFVYAQQLVSGRGLTWFGSYVEGYTNFLWVVLMSLGMILRIEPVLFSWLLGIGSFLVVVYSTAKIALHVTDSALSALLAALLLIGNYSVSSYATGGLETMMQTMWICLVMCCFFQGRASGRSSQKAAAMWSLFSGLAILTRLDSAALIAVIGVFQCVDCLRKKTQPVVYLWLVLPGFILVVGHLVWKIAYYGKILPNTFAAKVGWDLEANLNGIRFLWRFFHWYWLWPFFLLGILAMLIKKQKPPFGVFPLAAAIGVWSLYIVSVGGDFMEFRFMVPVAPYLFILLACLLWITGKELLQRPAAYCALSTAIILMGSGYHALTFTDMSQDRRLDSIDALSTFYGVYPDEQWDWLGKRLGDELGDSGAVIALQAVGAIPFYSRLKTIDMWGLNDPVIPLEGSVSPKGFIKPGHRRHAKLSYLKEQGVNFIIGHPTLVSPDMLTQQDSMEYLTFWLRTIVAFNTEPINEATLVTIPLDDETSLLVWYLIHTERLDRIIKEHRWNIVELCYQKERRYERCKKSPKML